jgi:hypothetical protein
MTSDRKKPGVALWATVVLVVVPLLYVLSFGPACWISSRTGIGASVVGPFYRPILLIGWNTRVISWYSGLWSGPNWEFGHNPETNSFSWMHWRST